MSVQKFRKRPIVIEAIQWDGTSEGATPIIDWMRRHGTTARYLCSDPIRCNDNDGDTPHHIAIDTLEGTMSATVGDWVVRGIANEFYPCKDDIWRATTELVEDEE